MANHSPDHGHDHAPEQSAAHEGGAHSHDAHSHGPHSHDAGNHADHGGFHHHHVPGSNRAFAIGVTLNIGFVIVEIIFGLIHNSLALLADAGHNFGDVIGLLLAWGAMRLALRKPSGRYTYGLGGATILAALANAMLLILATGAITLEAVQRLFSPEPVGGKVIIIVALVGVVINAATAMLFMRGSKHDLNLRGAYLHMAADAGVSLGVAIVGVLILLGGAVWLDPAASLLIAAVILISTWGLLRDSVQLAMQAVPAHIDVEAVKKYLAARKGVSEVHDLHIWAMSTTETALTAHLVMPEGHPGDAFFAELADGLLHEFRIAHPTIQIEVAASGLPAHVCN
jgi:cobalt-zinc-cadmium efflux system protein